MTGPGPRGPTGARPWRRSPADLALAPTTRALSPAALTGLAAGPTMGRSHLELAVAPSRHRASSGGLSAKEVDVKPAKPKITRREAMRRIARVGAAIAAGSVATACVETPTYSSVSHYASTASAQPYSSTEEQQYSSLAVPE